MALTVPTPSSSFSEFGWIFHNTHLDSSIYQDEDMMDFSDNSADYQTSPQQTAPPPQQQQQVSICLFLSKSSLCLPRNCAHVMLFPLLVLLSRINVCFFILLIRKYM